MVVAFFLLSIFTILDGFFRAPLQTRKALLTTVLPYGFTIGQQYVLCRTDFFTDCAISAFLVSQKRFIHLVNIRIRLAIKQRKKNILPGRTFFQRVYFF